MNSKVSVFNILTSGVDDCQSCGDDLWTFGEMSPEFGGNIEMSCYVFFVCLFFNEYVSLITFKSWTWESLYLLKVVFDSSAGEETIP